MKPAPQKDAPPVDRAAEMAEEAALAAEPWPEDWPEMRPLLALPRVDRAAILDAYADVIEKLPELQGQRDEPEPETVAEPAVPDPDRPKGNAGRAAWSTYAADKGVEVTKDMGRDAIVAAVDQAHRGPVDFRRVAAATRRAALVTRVVGGFEEVLVLAAEDADVFRAWLSTADDSDVLSMFLRYARRTQVGKASS
jgi:hypothetical protein